MLPSMEKNTVRPDIDAQLREETYLNEIPGLFFLEILDTEISHLQNVE